MAKISGLTKSERKLAQRIGNGSIRKGQGMSDALALGVGFVIARRTEPTLGLKAYLDGHTADEVRDMLEDYPRRSSGSGSDDK